MIRSFFSNSFNLIRLALVFLCLVTATSSATEDQETTTMPLSPVLVVGASGATGRHVVRQLLEQGREVRAIVRSKERMLSYLREDAGDDGGVPNGDRLVMTEASLLDLSDADLEGQVRGTGAVVSCLGHTLDFRGIFGQPRRLVTDATRRLTAAMNEVAQKGGDDGVPTTKKKKFVLMGSEGVVDPAGTDDVRPFTERAILFLLRYLVQPHADNEEAAAYVHSQLGRESGVEWVVVRPTDLIDGDAVPEYTLYSKPTGSLFGSGPGVSRRNVARTMVDLLTDDKMWDQYKFTMPVVHDASTAGDDKEKTEGSEL